MSQYSGNFYRFVTQRPSRTIKATAILTVLLFVPQLILTWRAYQRFENITTYELKLQTLSDEIIYLDEVLTMSAQMNAATGNRMWEKRYRKFEPKLDKAIQKSIELAPKIYSSENAKQTDSANQKLVEMEYQSFDFVKNGKNELAQALLSSNKYKLEKIKYHDGVENINIAITEQVTNKVKIYRKQLLLTSIFVFLSLVMLIPSWLIVLQLLNEYLKQRQIARKALEKTNQELELRVEERTQELSDKNNQLQETLETLQDTQIQLIHTEKMSGLGQLVGGVAHEINNPVTFIDGNIVFARQYAEDLLKLLELYQQCFPNPPLEIQNEVEALELDFLKKDIFKIHESMKVGTQRIRDIVLSLRNFSRLDEADFKQVDIHEGIDSTLLILQNRLKLKAGTSEILIVKNYNQVPLIECYPSQLNQALINILSNAIDAIETQLNQNDNKSFIPQIIITTDVSANNHITIQIADNGCGMTNEVSTKLFDPFFTTKPIGKGTGLGLSIAYKIIASKHHGKLSYSSELGKGTEFTIEIPVTL
ncbi:MAG: two-component sensor histidine kinase [Rivularia sp. (in: Bacteria)]|nr:two-component sensor histidine kinase [Rivularia sp. MS3]